MLSKILRQMLADGASAEQIVHIACTGLLEIEERSLGRKERNRQAARKYRRKINDSVITVITNHDDAKNHNKINGHVITNHDDAGVSSSKKERKEEERTSEYNLSAEVNGTAVLPINGKYFFEAGVIRLIERDYLRWEKAFPHISLRAELEGCTCWAQKQQNWFQAVAGLLAKREREAVNQINVAKATPERKPRTSGLV